MVSQLKIYSENKKIWGLKDPQLTEHLDAIKQFLPDARYIVIIRDARAVTRSYIENAWGLGTNCYTGALRWKKEVQMQLDFVNELGDKVLMFKYEDLVLNQEQTLKKICGFINVPFDPSMLNYQNKKSFVMVSRESSNTFKKLDPKIIVKWKKELSEHQIKIVNMVCCGLLKRLDYEVDKYYVNIPKWKELYYRMHQKVIGEIQIQYRWRIGGYKRKIKGWLKK